jgi:hypothetical protein
MSKVRRTYIIVYKYLTKHHKKFDEIYVKDEICSFYAKSDSFDVQKAGKFLFFLLSYF